MKDDYFNQVDPKQVYQEKIGAHLLSMCKVVFVWFI